MIYITVMQSPRYRQMTLDELFFGNGEISQYVNRMETNTRTYIAKSLKGSMLEKVDIESLTTCLREYNQKYDHFFDVDRRTLYTTFSIPKRSGGLRRIDAPKSELMEALRQLKHILETRFYALYHTSAFAYVRGRSTISALKKHQQNQSKWFMKLDFSNFFGSTTMAFLMSQLSIIFPFCEIVKNEESHKLLLQTMSLCFLNGGLPQGTPISPLLTNLLMIPIDHQLCNSMRDFEKQSFVYTRYADDILLSSKHDFDCKKVYKHVIDVIQGFSAPYRLNPEKTRYGSSAGSNWNLGLMLNKDNDITIGHQKKKQFKAMINNFSNDHISGVLWPRSDVQELQGLISYYKMVEKPYIEYVLSSYSNKYGFNVRKAIRERIKNPI